MDCQLSEKRAIGFNVHLGFELGYFFGIESEFNDRARKLANSLIILNLKRNHKYSKNVNLDYIIHRTYMMYLYLMEVLQETFMAFTPLLGWVIKLNSGLKLHLVMLM